MTLGQDTFDLTKREFNEKLSRIIKNFRANSRVIGEPRDFILRACKLTERWSKLANDSEVAVYLRNIDTAGGHKVKLISLERGTTRQPVPKAKLVDELYPVRRTATSATTEEKHYNTVKAAMRRGISSQLKEYRDSIELPAICPLSGRKIRPGMRTDVDHIGHTFSEIADRFLESASLRYTDITLKGPSTAKVFTDANLWKDWIEFHRECARYSLTLASANRSEGSKGYVTPKELIGSFQAEDPESLSLDF
jgi:hypothetical protein